MRRSAAWLVALAACAGSAPPSTPCEPLQLSTADCAEVIALAGPGAPPPARGNRFADSLPAARLGFAVFFDARFSSNQEVRCASCHAPETSFQDGRPLPQAQGFVGRNTPTLLNAAALGWQFWDGRADSLWSQALYAFENPAEMNFTRLELAHQLRALYRADYEAVFGLLPDLADTARFPPRGAPGTSAWDAMAPADRDAVNRVVANLGKAMEAYVRKLYAGPSRVDRFLGGDATALSAVEARGLAVFAQAKCTACHSGPVWSDGRFHDLGVAPAAGRAPDRGRADGLARLLASPFSAHGAYFDGPPPADEAALYQPSAADLGAFRTPPLRSVARTAPYGHDGSFPTLEAIVDFHLAGGGRGRTDVVGDVDPLLQPRTLSADDRAALVALLRALDGKPPPLPWADWPQH